MNARRVALLAACFAWSLVPGIARADDKATCMKAHEHGQEMRLANHWVEAQRLFLTCAQSSCPTLIVQDCTRWEDELSQRIPSVVVAVKRRDGSDVDEVGVFVDGARLENRPLGVPIPLDPGEHVLRFERPGWSEAERRVILHDGEQERRVEVTLEPPTPTVRDARQTSGAPVGAYVASGVAAAAAITSIVFLAIGKLNEHDLATSPCGLAGTCADSQVQPIRIDYVVSGISAGVGVVAVAIAVWQIVARNSRPAVALDRAGRLEF